MTHRTWIAVGVAVVSLIVVMAVAGGLWMQVGDSEITPAGWVAMILGVVLTAAIGVGLMTLVFISNRRGYDDDVGGR